jgi:hypothetical protein
MAKKSEIRSQRRKDLSSLHIIQTGSGAYPASYPVGTWGSFPRNNVDRVKSLMLPTTVKVKNVWIYKSTFPYIFMA